MSVANWLKHDIRTPATLDWDPADVPKSVKVLLLYVETQAQTAMEWYWARKKWKSRLSRTVQASSMLLAAAGGLAPVVVKLWNPPGVPVDSGLWASLFLGVAASLLGLDKAFGYSTAWARYVMAATSIRKALEEFRMDWTQLSAQLTSNPSADDIAKLLQRAKDFRLAVENIVQQETKDWITEFQSNLAKLEKDLTTQFDALKSQVEKTAQAQLTAAEPGSIELTVPNADKTDGFTFDVDLQGASGVIAHDKVSNSKKWARINVAPGQHRLSLTATMGGKPVATATVVIVKPKEQSKPEVPLS